jgi:hypothetical protein
MGIIVSFNEVRAERVKARLCALATSRSPAVVETAGGLIDAHRIFCRDGVAVLVDRDGCHTRLGYSEITDVSPLLSAADIIRLANWQVTESNAAESAATAVVPFPSARPTQRAD